MKRLQRGFTLIELLVVIAVLAVLAAGVITAINPAKRIRQATDAKIRNDIGQIATGLQSYATTNSGIYPLATPGLSALVSNGDIKQIPPGPGAPCATYLYAVSGTCTSTSCEAAVYCQLNDPVTPTPGNLWCWQSSTGQAKEVPTGACTAP